MPKVAKELSAIEVKRLKKPGYHAVGGVAGLGLRINDKDGKSWILRTMVGGKRKDIGLGGYPDVALAEARDRARALRADVRDGKDPVSERRSAHEALKAAQKRGMTFAEACEGFLSSNRLDGLKNEKHRKQWRSTLETYAIPLIGPKVLAELTTNDIKSVLDPIWATKHETATRLRGRIEEVIDWAIVHGHREQPNPASWKGNLKQLLPTIRSSGEEEHWPAVPVDLAPAWFAALRKREGIAALALQFLALTAARSGEVRGATWSEIDFEKALWVIPARRMKAKREHRVPLSPEAIELLSSAPRYVGSDHVFPSVKGAALSDMSISAVMRRMQDDAKAKKEEGWIDPRVGRPAVPHGLRSTFRDWVDEKTNYQREMAEIALAHKVGSSVEQAYRRTDLLEKRRQMMEDWAAFLSLANPFPTVGNAGPQE